MPEDIFTPIRFRKEVHERMDLLPPASIEAKNIGRSSTIPFETTIDKVSFTKLINEEGITGGKNLELVMNYNPGFLRQFTAIDNKPYRDFINEGRTISSIFRDGMSLGTARTLPDQTVVTLNMGTIYDHAVLRSPRSVDDIQTNLERIVSHVLAHELGHARQHKSLTGMSMDIYLKVIGGSFVLIDGLRRTQLPWVGLAEPLVVSAELTGAELVSHIAYRSTEKERFANEYADSSAKLYKDMMTVTLTNPKQLEMDWEFWRPYKNRQRNDHL
jgi:hypothetical protein